MAFQIRDYAGLDGSQLDTYTNVLPISNFAGDGIALGQEYGLRQSILADGGVHYGVSSLAFDFQEELLWMGNQGGHVTSYYSSELQKFTSFGVNLNYDIREIVTIDAGVLALTSNSLKLSSRRGLTVFDHCSEQMQHMQCMVLTPKGTLLMGGHHSNLIELNLETIEEVNLYQMGESNCAILRKHPRFICSGSVNGKVALHDPNTLRIEHVIDSHSGMLSDFDVHGNQLVTCGFSASRHGELSVDRYLMIYDLRLMRSMTPIQMVFPPFLLRFITAYTSRLCVVSQNGQFQMVDTGNSDQYALFIHQVETGGVDLLSFATSSSCQALAFGDSAGYFHLYAASDQAQFNVFSRPTEFADSVMPLPPIDINDELTPLSSIPMPHCEGKLLSAWPEEFCQYAYRPTPNIDSQIWSTMKMVGSIGYSPNPGTKLRNQVPYQLNHNKNSSHASPVPKDDSLITVPQRYMRMEMKYTRTGMDDIDINRFNRTCFSGLEANLPNSYCNNMLQVLYFIEPLRCALLSHCCQKEFCLSCELGFLFHMLDTPQGFPCQASNFLRAFRTIPEASALGLIVADLSESKKRCSLTTLVQRWTRFILQQIHTETHMTVDIGIVEDCNLERLSELNGQSITNKLFGAKLFNCNRCRCGCETYQESTTLLSSLSYPDCHPIDKPPIAYTFAQVVQRSLAFEQNITAWCEKCRRFLSMVQTKILTSLPDILVLSCGLENKKDIKFWETQLKLLSNSGQKSVMKVLPDVPVMRRKACRYGVLCKRSDCIFYHEPKHSGSTTENSSTSQSWIPLNLKIAIRGGEIIVEELQYPDNNKNESQRNEDQEENIESLVYDLTAMVSVIPDNQDCGNDNIVSCINIGPAYHVKNKGSPTHQWYLFNDFSVVPVTAQEVVYLNFDWKLPSVLYFSRTDLNSQHDLTVFNPVGEQVFRDDVSLARSGQSHITFTPLTVDNPPTAGQLVAIDAEFVTLNQEEAEIRSDGTRSTIRPSQFSVARISCVRGEGPLEGVPFIDDYISTQEQVVDYATKFSGIQPGDLDAAISSKHLTTLKSTYQKLRYLVDIGVRFIGHGLKNDFRVINLVVPPEQVADTVYLFQLPNKRMISLRFLAWHFLGLKIQSETHDSIEDAKTALQLYKKYVDLQRKGEVVNALKELYDIGRSLQWKVPGIDS